MLSATILSAARNESNGEGIHERISSYGKTRWLIQQRQASGLVRITATRSLSADTHQKAAHGERSQSQRHRERNALRVGMNTWKAAPTLPRKRYRSIMQAATNAYLNYWICLKLEEEVENVTTKTEGKNMVNPYLVPKAFVTKTKRLRRGLMKRTVSCPRDQGTAGAFWISVLSGLSAVGP